MRERGGVAKGKATRERGGVPRAIRQGNARERGGT